MEGENMESFGAELSGRGSINFRRERKKLWDRGYKNLTRADIAAYRELGEKGYNRLLDTVYRATCFCADRDEIDLDSPKFIKMYNTTRKAVVSARLHGTPEEQIDDCLVQLLERGRIMELIEKEKVRMPPTDNEIRNKMVREGFSEPDATEILLYMQLGSQRFFEIVDESFRFTYAVAERLGMGNGKKRGERFRQIAQRIKRLIMDPEAYHGHGMENIEYVPANDDEIGQAISRKEAILSLLGSNMRSWARTRLTAMKFMPKSPKKRKESWGDVKKEMRLKGYRGISDDEAKLWSRMGDYEFQKVINEASTLAEVEAEMRGLVRNWERFESLDKRTKTAYVRLHKERRANNVGFVLSELDMPYSNKFIGTSYQPMDEGQARMDLHIRSALKTTEFSDLEKKLMGLIGESKFFSIREMAIRRAYIEARERGVERGSKEFQKIQKSNVDYYCKRIYADRMNTPKDKRNDFIIHPAEDLELEMEVKRELEMEKMEIGEGKDGKE